MRFLSTCLAFGLLGILSATSANADVEKAAAIDGSQYTVIAPVYDGSSGAISFIRLVNAAAGASTFNITIVNTNNGIVLGAAAILVPAKASPQYPLVGDDSIFSRAGVAASSGASYALYIQNSEVLSGYQHVTFNSVSTLFENNSVCTTSLDQQLAYYSKPRMLPNVHSSNFATTYPSVLTLHNYTSAQATVTIRAYNATTGTTLGQAINRTISANGTSTLAETDLEQILAIVGPSAHINFEIGTSAGATPAVRLTHTVRNTKLAGDVNMAEVCAVNAVAPTVVQAASTVPTAYCGTLHPAAGTPFPYNVATYILTLSVAPNGRIRGTIFASYAGTTDGDSFNGTASGTNLSVTTSDGIIATGTIQNGSINGTVVGAYGVSSFSASTSSCY